MTHEECPAGLCWHFKRLVSQVVMGDEQKTPKSFLANFSERRQCNSPSVEMAIRIGDKRTELHGPHRSWWLVGRRSSKKLIKMGDASPADIV